MSVELQMLVWSGILALVLTVIAVLAAQSQVGLPTLAGNRDNMPALTGVAMRAQRAHLNMLESLVVFAIFVLVAVLAERTNAMTALGATIFFWARLAHALIYLTGIPWLRTAAWAVSVVGILMVLLQLF